MQIVMERYEVPFEQLPKFLSEHIDEELKITTQTDTAFTFVIEQEYTEPEFHMGVLFNISHSHSATEEEKNACEYAINCIKTLMDMGVLNDDNSK